VSKERNPVPERKFRLSALEILLLTVIFIGLIFMIRIVVAPEVVSDSRLSATVSQLEQRITEISEYLNLPEPTSGMSKDAFSKQKKGTESVPQLAERVNRLEQKVEELERRSGQKGGATKDDDVAVIRDSPRKRAVSD